ncbi:transcription factor MYB119-like protein, partial [Tanacetum coccineum]
MESGNQGGGYPNFGKSRKHPLVPPPMTAIGRFLQEIKSNGGNGKRLIKGQWTDEEDKKLLRLVKLHGERKWDHIAEQMIGRAGKQCRERWHNHLRPDIK